MDAVETLVARAKARMLVYTPEERKALREHAGITQIELAHALGVSRQTLIRWENGERFPRQEERLRYARALELLKTVVR